jgi:hypothetical protein
VKNREGEERLSQLVFYPGFGPWPIEKCEKAIYFSNLF